MPEILYRPLQPDERNFVLKPVVRYILGNAAPLVKKHHAEAAKKTANELLDRSTVVVAEYEQRKGQLFGFVMFEPQKCLHAIYVKDMMRGQGIGSALLAVAREYLPGELKYTIRTPMSKRFLPEAEYAPRLVNK